MSKTRAILTCAFACVGFVTTSEGVAPQETVLQRTADYGLGLEGPLLSVVDEIAGIYRVPLSFEWSVVDERRFTVEYPMISFPIRKGETLSSALDRLVATCEGKIRWERIHGVVYVRPAGDDGRLESLLDVRISLDLKNVSTWHAFVELARAVNEAATGDRFLTPAPVGFDDGRTPLPALRDDESVTLSLSNVTAREAACAIIAASSLYMKFWYHNDYRARSSEPSARLSLWPLDENGNFLPGPPMSRVPNFQVWKDEARTALPDRTTAPARVPEE
jgi:hypothetical protein